ncbi:unnamed protein product, partial [Amoebophrya sp. A25]
GEEDSSFGFAHGRSPPSNKEQEEHVHRSRGKTAEADAGNSLSLHQSFFATTSSTSKSASATKAHQQHQGMANIEPIIAAKHASPRAFLSCTAEMCPVDAFSEVVVLDEAQLLLDPERGGAWTRVLLGAQCDELHLCGMVTPEKEFSDLVRDLLERECQDVLVSCARYERFQPLVVERTPVQQLRPGDCIVCFSRRDVWRIRSELETMNHIRFQELNRRGGVEDKKRMRGGELQDEQEEDSESDGGAAVVGFEDENHVGSYLGPSNKSTKKTAQGSNKLESFVLYGSLPSEVRREQAEKFNRNVDDSILIATDCIGLGLNLRIRRIIFASVHKFDGRERRELTPFEIRQIAGRAGRGKSVGGTPHGGRVGCFAPQDLAIV